MSEVFYRLNPKRPSKIDLNQYDTLGLAWLCEQASMWRAHIGDEAWATKLKDDASRLRAMAVNL